MSNSHGLLIHHPCSAGHRRQWATDTNNTWNMGFFFLTQTCFIQLIRRKKWYNLHYLGLNVIFLCFCLYRPVTFSFGFASTWRCAYLNDLGSNLSSATFWFCDLGKFLNFFWVTTSSSAKRGWWYLPWKSCDHQGSIQDFSQKGSCGCQLWSLCLLFSLAAPCLLCLPSDSNTFQGEDYVSSMTWHVC